MVFFIFCSQFKADFEHFYQFLNIPLFVLPQKTPDLNAGVGSLTAARFRIGTYLLAPNDKHKFEL
ncbi:MAG: hypothetical protein LBD46_00470 [Endomicrobium sp.]|jgi:hypothetical protein|nr:hypothetical protein [Endomicrobium sp.]